MVKIGVVVIALVGTGCEEDLCDLDGISKTGELLRAAPDGMLMVTATGCSTCGHAKVTGTWDLAVDPSATGTVEIILSPQCPVADIEVQVQPGASFGGAEGNVRNCGDVVDYVGYVTNRTNLTFERMTIQLTCPTYME